MVYVFLFLFCCSYSEGSIDFSLEKKEFYVKHGDQINLKGTFFVEGENTPLIIRVESPEGFVIDMSQSVYYSPYSEFIEINISVSSSLPPGKYKLKVLVENIDVFDTEEVMVNLSPGICKSWLNVSDSLGFEEYLKRNNRLVKIVDDKILLQENGDQWSELMNIPLPSPNWVTLDQKGLPIVVYSDVVLN